MYSLFLNNPIDASYFQAPCLQQYFKYFSIKPSSFLPTISISKNLFCKHNVQVLVCFFALYLPILQASQVVFFYKYLHFYLNKISLPFQSPTTLHINHCIWICIAKVRITKPQDLSFDEEQHTRGSIYPYSGSITLKDSQLACVEMGYCGR